jgi:hypothetical protein
MLKVYNMESPRTGKAVANQYVICENGEHMRKTTFQSYDSMIVEIDHVRSTITFGRDWDYSNTTRKYRNAFLTEFVPQIADKKILNKLHDECTRDAHGRTKAVINGFNYIIRFE